MQSRCRAIRKGSTSHVEGTYLFRFEGLLRFDRFGLGGIFRATFAFRVFVFMAALAVIRLAGFLVDFFARFGGFLTTLRAILLGARLVSFFGAGAEALLIFTS